MAKAIITLEDIGNDEVSVKLSFDPALSGEFASHRLAAAMLETGKAQHEPLDDEETRL